MFCHQASAALLVALAVAGCKSYDFGAGTMDEAGYSSTSRDGPATIQLSDPQLYARATLLNDRRREQTFLEGQLEKSETVTFTPQLQRELTQIASLAAQLGISFSPLAALQHQDFKQSNALQQQLDRLALDFQVAKLQKDLEAFKSSYTGDAAAIPDRPASAAPPAAQTAPSTAAMVTQLQASLDKLTALLSAAPALARPADLTADPRETFADRQALRLDLRSALAEAQTDDRHDDVGNSLFRLQFRATITPPEQVSKWGIAELYLQRPEGSPDDFKRLYAAWLAHNTHRLNAGLGSAKRDQGMSLPDTAPLAFASGSGLLDIAHLRFKIPKGGGPDEVEGAGRLDPCQHVRSERHADALGCDTIYLALPAIDLGYSELGVPELRPRDLVSPPFATFLDFDFRQLVRAMHDALLWNDLQKYRQYFALDKACTQFTDRTFVPTPSQPSTDLQSDVDAFIERIVEAGSVGPSSLRDSPAVDASVLRGQISRSLSTLGGPTQIRSAEKMIAGLPASSATLRDQLNRLRSEGTALFMTALEIQRTWPMERRLRLMSPEAAFRFAQYMLTLAPSVSASLKGVTSRRELDASTQRKVLFFVSVTEETTQLSRQYLRMLQRLNPDCAGHAALNTTTYEERGRIPPNRFCSLLRLDQEEGPSSCERGALDGRYYAHASSPTQLSQRISTVSNVADAVQLAVNLQAAVPKSGVAAEAAAGFARQSAMKAQALQRRPIVVGFSGSADPMAAESSETRFGWVFGPPAQVAPDGRSLLLEQAVANHQVNADVSVPGWWPKIELAARTLWVGNWRDGRLISASKDAVPARTIGVPLPLKRADLDGLTEFLASKTLGRGQHLTRINDVQPSAISVCASTATIVIYGANVWRNPRIFVGGIEAENSKIEVLPDMEGVAATIRTDGLRTRSHKLPQPMVVVWTRDGYDQFPITVTGRVDKADKCIDELATSPARESGGTSITKVFPQRISSCEASIEFTVIGKNLSTTKGDYYFGAITASAISPLRGPTSEATAVKVRFDDLRKGNVGLETVEIALLKPDGFETATVLVQPEACAVAGKPR
jgi:hypothetical protein